MNGAAHIDGHAKEADEHKRSADLAFLYSADNGDVKNQGRARGAKHTPEKTWGIGMNKVNKCSYCRMLKMYLMLAPCVLILAATCRVVAKQQSNAGALSLDHTSQAPHKHGCEYVPVQKPCHDVGLYVRACGLKPRAFCRAACEG